MKTVNIIESIIDRISTGDNRQMSLLIAGISFVILISLIFFIILPEINNIKLTDNVLKSQKTTLNYILKYSNKINRLKLIDNVKIKAYPSTRTTMKKGYVKFIDSLIKYFKINKEQVSKLYSRYSSGKGTAGGGAPTKESVVIYLKGLSLNQCVNMIYALSSSYHAKIVSIKIKKNFQNDKLLNLSLYIERRIKG